MADDGLDTGASIAHDLRAPLRAVEGFARLLKEDCGSMLDRVGLDYIDRILGASQRMNAMIDTLLDLAQLSAQSVQRQAVNLSQVSGFILDDLSRQEPKRHVTVRIEPDIVKYGDPPLLKRVLENLLGNAWKYTSKRDHALIEVDTLVTEDGRSAVRVRDNGAGFDMKRGDQLFTPFQRLHAASEFPGHGVGLATVRRIIERHGGQIWAEGVPGQGATFCFSLAERRGRAGETGESTESG